MTGAVVVEVTGVVNIKARWLCQLTVISESILSRVKGFPPASLKWSINGLLSEDDILTNTVDERVQA